MSNEALPSLPDVDSMIARQVKEISVLQERKKEAVSDHNFMIKESKARLEELVQQRDSVLEAQRLAELKEEADALLETGTAS